MSCSGFQIPNPRASEFKIRMSKELKLAHEFFACLIEVTRKNARASTGHASKGVPLAQELRTLEGLNNPQNTFVKTTLRKAAQE